MFNLKFFCVSSVCITSVKLVVVYRMFFIVPPHILMRIKSARNVIFALFLLVALVNTSSGSLLSTLLPEKIPDYGETALNKGNIFFFSIKLTKISFS